MKHMITSGLVSMLLLICATVSANGVTDNKEISQLSQQRILLKFNLKPGEKFLFSSTSQQRIEQEMMGQQMVSMHDMLSEYHYDVQQVNNGVTTINVTFSKIKMDMDVAGMQRVSYDSDNAEAATAELKGLNDLVGKSFLMQVDASGSIKKIEGLSEILASLPTDHADMIKQSFNDSSMVHNMNQFTDVYPNKQVAVGDKWTKLFSGPVAGILQAESNSTFSLTGIEGDLAIVETSGAMKFSKLEGSAANAMLQGAQFNLNGTQTGTMEIEIKSGLPVSTKLEQHITGDIDVQGFKIPMSIHSTMAITGRKL